MQSFVFFVFLFSISSLGYSQSNPILKCLTHGDCQLDSTLRDSEKCFVVKVGINNSGEWTCAIKCYKVKLGSYCKAISSESFGYCKSETEFDMPDFDINDPNRCDNAINPPN